MESGALVRRYFDCLEAGDLEGVLALFAPDAVVDSPIQGRVGARDFYRDLFRNTRTSRITLLHELAGEGAAAAHFRYEWTLANGESVSFEGADVFELAPDGRVRRLAILYDADAARRAYARLASP